MFKEITNVRYAPDIIFGLDNENVKVTNRKRAIIDVKNGIKKEIINTLFLLMNFIVHNPPANKNL